MSEYTIIASRVRVEGVEPFITSVSEELLACLRAKEENKFKFSLETSIDGLRSVVIEEEKSGNRMVRVAIEYREGNIRLALKDLSEEQTNRVFAYYATMHPKLYGN